MRFLSDAGISRSSHNFSALYTFTGTTATHTPHTTLSVGKSYVVTMITKGGIRWLADMRQVKLLNGRNVELNSKEGADEFVATVARY
jgi:hypothetical protein